MLVEVWRSLHMAVSFTFPTSAWQIMNLMWMVGEMVGIKLMGIIRMPAQIYSAFFLLG